MIFISKHLPNIVSFQSDGTEVKCTSTKESLTLSCQVGYPALRQNQEVRPDNKQQDSRRVCRSMSLSAGVAVPKQYTVPYSLQVTFGINFDFNLNQLQTEADVSFEALR